MNTPDATWLFENRDPEERSQFVSSRCGRNSESFWTAVLALLLLHVNQTPESLELPVQHLPRDQDRWEFSPDGRLDCSGVSFSSLFVEATLDQNVVSEICPDVAWPVELSKIAPDLVISEVPRRRLTLIENKTVRAGPGSLEAYARAANYLRTQGWDADLVVAISKGHPNNELWNTIREHDLGILLWEDILEIMDKDSVFHSLLGVPLERYYRG